MVSVDTPAEAARTRGAHELPFSVLSDSDLALHQAFKVLNKVGEEMAEKFKAYGIDLEKSSGRKHHTIAVPALFVIDSAGEVRWAHADHDYKTRPSMAQVLAALTKLDLAKK